jgi:hypothetical protein
MLLLLLLLLFAAFARHSRAGGNPATLLLKSLI